MSIFKPKLPPMAAVNSAQAAAAAAKPAASPATRMSGDVLSSVRGGGGFRSLIAGGAPGGLILKAKGVKRSLIGG